ncbi:MAG: hypothetical protein GY790_00235 [Bacteroidetes bacterium]|nr:hypothetical protein [Bacteroidota bacterium]
MFTLARFLQHAFPRPALWLVGCLSIVLFASCKEKITIVTSTHGDHIEKFAAEELRAYLSEIYPDCDFAIGEQSVGGKSIYLVVSDTIEGVPDSDEGYILKSDGNRASIISKGSTGLIYGVYGLLEQLGCGFFLSDEMLPAQKENFDFSGWDFSNEPLIEERFVFNWHNFISGCSGWDKQHWLEWIDRSQKMGYNTVMIHSYHNNPMHTYEYRGFKKEVGYINTSAKGRDWGNIPINDVRRLPGGEIFDNAVFGSEIAMVPDDRRTEIAQSVMAEVFSYALARGVKVNYAIDIDMPLLFLKNSMIQSIPEDEKFYLSKDDVWIPLPDTPEGYAFYKAQLEGLLFSYPMLENITFFRRGASFFRNAGLNELPGEWQEEYASVVRQNPNLEALDKKEVIGSFITARLVAGYQQILKDMGKENITIGTGSWNHYFVVPTAAFLPEDIRLMPIDWNSRFEESMMEDDVILHEFASPECEQRVVPFIWAHHDDGMYVGRPYKPTENLYTKLQQGECKSFGVFHWMNRPLDLFFKGMSRQVWSATVNESLDKTIRFSAPHYFGTESMSVYFEEWMSNAPMFGRATLKNFFYRGMDEAVFDFERTIVECEKRIAILDGADVSNMTEKQKEYIDYFKTLEQFIIDFSKTQPFLLNAEKFLDEGDMKGAQEELKRGDPNQCIRTFSKLSQIVKSERGEMAYTYRLACKYVPDYLSFEQRTRLKPYYVNIDSVVYEDLAQGNGINLTYHIDPSGIFWESLGEREFVSPVVNLSREPGLNDNLEPFVEIFQYGIKVSESDTIPIQAIMRARGVRNASAVWEGEYELEILVASEKNSETSFKVDINGNERHFTVTGESIVSTTIKQEETGLMSLIIEPENGNIIVCGVILNPV